MKKSVCLVLALLAALWVSGCAEKANHDSGSTASRGVVQDNAAQNASTDSLSFTPEPGDVVVRLTNMRFEPQVVRVKSGQRVVFRNDDTTEHDIVQGDIASNAQGLFASPKLAPGRSWGYTAVQKGTYPIKCVVAGHYALGMTGTLIVE